MPRPKRLHSLVAALVLAVTSMSGCTDPQETTAQYYCVAGDCGGPPAGDDGARCTSLDACDGSCVFETEGWPNGYCTTYACEEGGCHGEDAVCVTSMPGAALCLDGCEEVEDCRRSYDCVAVDGVDTKVCLPAEAGVRSGEIGASCLGSGTAPCDEGLSCDDVVAGGVCIKAGCGGCPGGSVCASWPGEAERACVASCLNTLDCRTGFVCEGGGCLPSDSPEPEVAFEATREALGMRCDAVELGDDEEGTRYGFDFQIGAEASSFMVVPFVEAGHVLPRTLKTPGAEVDLVTDYRHHNLRVTELELFEPGTYGTYGEIAFDWPILVPYAPRFADYVVPGGEYRLEVVTNTVPPCFYVVEGREGRETAVIDLNLYFVRVDGLDASSAPANADLQEVLEQVSEIYGQVGVGLGEVSYQDSPREMRERYGIVRGIGDLRRLTATGSAPSESLDGHLSVDVFLVEDFILDGYGSGAILGISAGVPGPPGVHGNAANGLVFQMADLGYDNSHVAHVMAHEIAHYLGLRHTTEMAHGQGTVGAELDALVGTVDPVEDTPLCADIRTIGNNCPDRTNLLFPAAPLPGAGFEPILSAGQGAVMRANPLVK